MTNDQSTFGGRLLIGASGSAAVAMLPMYISGLRAQFTGTITVLMTPTATRFLPAHTVALFADRVVTGEPESSWARHNQATLAAEHDMLAVLPATANLLAATASGAAGNMLSTTILAATFPVAIFPVMTGEMWEKPSVQRNVEVIKADGYRVVAPEWGKRYDVALGGFVESTVPPAPPMVVSVIRELMPAG
ncbi:flavoprotein [Kibdelosporangium philippinense]|uniref:Flavoprotein n=1 Tax=Kibdelosporangium philippinense TaxID=211113 RepID=A0ABS8ZTE0_9PSEU|nr:flavoprotein [Kibdelosporangium philippinense]MCE7010867.1 flavoprotein [Kibdelosporangium philippinense]